MHAKVRKAFLLSSVVLLAGTLARAQSATDPVGDLLANLPAEAPAPVTQHQTVRRPLSEADAANFRRAVDSARRADVSGARAAIAAIDDSLARKAATWVLVDANSQAVSFHEADRARRELDGWPREARRQQAAERLLETSGKSPHQIVEWFGGREPQTAEGAIALASAWRVQGKTGEASALIKRWWRDRSFEADAQRSMLARFGDVLTVDDHVRRADILLYGPQGPATRDIVALLPADQQQAAFARIALRSGAANATTLVNALPPSVAQSPGVAVERASFLRRGGMDTLAAAQLAYFPREVVTDEQADKIWDERRRLVLAALRNGDAQGAYAAVANSGLNKGSDATDAEFYAGWIALSKLKDPDRALKHFAAIERIGSSPITRGRAFYWQGRAAEAKGDHAAAQEFYAQGAQYYTTFYGQLAGEKLGQQLVLPKDPALTSAHRARFEGRDTVQAMRLFYDQGYRDLFRVFALSLDDTLPSLEDQALLVDLVRGYGDQDTSMKVVRGAAQRGMILAERGYPYRSPPSVANAPEPALVLGITRQESGFDPLVRSGVGARGMMQLMPATAQIVARRIGVSYSPSMLDEPEYNMRLGSSFLGQLVGQFSGSYVMATAGYNAGPGRPTQWTAFCGDPRGGSSDPLDFIECIPFSETRNYVMRVMEGMQVYRAKIHGGAVPITLSNDLRRGGYGYPPPAATVVTDAR
ncbi:transglycosylase SLT domain-containing protein [Phenylobacterium sp.]|uniref:lytic transglycosylase domain-containing protein n=1 Tax=Phenylobacterium sp. TaxID=1871053 RepID=UPI0035B288B2